MFRKALLPCFLLLFSIHLLSPAQTLVTPRCGHDAFRAMQARAQQVRQQSLDDQVAEWLQNGGMRTTALGNIPVVVHVIHQNGPENIPVSQIQAAISHLNDAFANAGAYTQANGTATGISFCLAVRDPNGNFHSGVNRVLSPLTDMTIENDDAGLKALMTWNTSQYLNVWVVNSITSLSGGSGVAGYATFPAAHGQPTDGIVIEHAFFGTGTNQSKVLVHEAGHYLGLYHTFEGACTNQNCLTDGDQVCDTPPDGSSASTTCGASPNTCQTDTQDPSPQNPFRPIALGGLGDQPDPFDNYMDYGYASCQIRLSQGQSDRMNAFLSTTRSSLASSMGCVTACPSPVSAAFTPNSNLSITVGTSINFVNSSAGATNYTWTQNGSVFSTQASPTYVFNQTGTFVIQLLAGNGNPSCADSISISVEVLCNLQANFSQNDPEVLPGDNVIFTQQSPGATSYTWLMDGVVVQTGNSYTHNFPSPGGFNVCLATYNGLCRDTACTYVAVGDCGRKRNNVWAFGGNNNGIDFNSGNPVPTPSSIVNRAEGFSSICNAQGQLLIYSDGSNVYRATGTNALGTLMPNGTGLWGGALGSSSHGSLIVPKPLDDSVFYIFTADEQAGEYGSTYGGVAYSIVDLRAGVNGEVTVKNVPIFTPSTEKLAAVRHSNGCDIWLMTHAYQTSNTEFRAYLLTPSGLNPVPVVSAVGFGHRGGLNLSNNTGNTIGQMKFSQDGSRLALAIRDTGRVEVFDFNKSTGVVSNPISVQLAPNQYAFGVEFSPDASKLYYDEGFVKLFQMDLNAGSPSAVLGSITLISQFAGGYGFHGMSLGPNGKIYITLYFSPYLHVINNPSASGLACNFVPGAVQLPNDVSFGLQSTLADYGSTLPAHAHGPVQVCVGNPFTYYFDQSSCADSVYWTVSPPAQVLSDAGGILEVIYPTAGPYTVLAESFTACGHVRDTLVVTASNFVGPNLGPDRSLCSGPVTLSPGTGYSSYAWSNGFTSGSLFVFTPGTYSVTVTNAAGCQASDTVVISSGAQLFPNLGPDLSVCPGGIRTLSPGTGFATVQWQDGSTNPQFTAWQPGSYWVRTTDACGNVGQDTLVIVADQSFQVFLGADTVICQGSTIPLSAGAGMISYLWSTGDIGSQIQVSTPGTYWVEVANMQGCAARDSIFIDDCVAIENGNSVNSLVLFPVPAEDQVVLQFASPIFGSVKISIYNALGEYSGQQVQDGSGMRQFVLPVADLADGVYLLVVETASGRYFRKMLKG